jgi:hypothetical protein
LRDVAPGCLRIAKLLRGGIGLFYDLVPSFIASLFTTNPPLLTSFIATNDNVAPAEATSLFKDTAVSNSAFLQGFADGETLAQIQQAISSLGPTIFRPPALALPGAFMHAAQYQKWSLGRTADFWQRHVTNA